MNNGYKLEVIGFACLDGLFVIHLPTQKTFNFTSNFVVVNIINSNIENATTEV
jgi:hypothetical protein